MNLLNRLKRLLPEGLIIFALILSINNYFGNESKVIKSDGDGYYDYLPALMIYGDLPKATDSIASERIRNNGVYISYKDHKLNKYPCGTATLMLPFFVYAHLTAPIQGFSNDGFTLPYQRAVFYAAVVYLLLALVFLRKLLLLYNTSRTNIFLIQCLVVFSTSIINYIYYDPSFSHVYSFFAITAFLYFVKAYFTDKKQSHFLWACLFFGLIFILRQLNILILFFIPFLAGSPEELKGFFMRLFKDLWFTFKGLILFLIVVSIQLYFWHWQTGEWLVYSYQSESFNFLKPAFMDILFSYRKGLFIYTPVLFLSLFALFIYIKKKKYYLLITWSAFFLFLTYVLSSWWSWFYGMSYGLRAYIDFYTVFCILLAVLLESKKRLVIIPAVLLLLLTIPVNLIQTLQYKKQILHWDSMDKQKYWTIFLETKHQFNGMVWKKEFVFSEEKTKQLYTSATGDKRAKSNSSVEVYFQNAAQILDFEKTNIIQVSFKNNFSPKEDASIELTVKDTISGEIAYSHSVPLIHFQEKGLNTEQTGVFNYEVPTMTAENKRVSLKVFTKEEIAELKDLKISYINYKY
ncbi:MAG: hypothetical protein IPN61_10715 [Bacteroidetes bacterium]|nr:hypothetical protein [Bacteroidota bacterium]MBK9413866.1 hypothetical protein [Bacteroidota bacterium]MBP6426516.1 hypothetical protein [Bacteroidia bacterium]MBP6658477.1 hypothetical protein [Bacteroidia bacterium]